MNWVSVVVSMITAYIILAWYLWQRHVFKGPKVDPQEIEQYSLQVVSLKSGAVTYSISAGGNSSEPLIKEMKAE
ncbi:hypothetical protein AOQ84DRAFT_351367 [Glonium stellatum]|uniref:Uncharacterized protein n=1 Tax=Glonium stellatum TaxID=574774 RepID=A0A8E2JYS8_9PEZI|nr:hypothetical protein AOQ84DRAFT_351367 [Glonium stellatum]